jgi:hypothetical protein
MPEEPMYLILNLGISPNFGAIDYEGLEEMWPVHMLVDYVRVYQDPKKINVGCDPEGFPTTKFIADNLVAFTSVKRDANRISARRLTSGSISGTRTSRRTIKSQTRNTAGRRID